MVEIEIQSHTVTQVKGANQKLLRPAPKALKKALKDSADRARRMAEAFGLKVPGIAPNPTKTGQHRHQNAKRNAGIHCAALSK